MKEKLFIYLLDNCQGVENIKQGKEIAADLEVSTEHLRYLIKKLRVEKQMIIGGNKKGYFIPRQIEMGLALNYAQNKVISEIETVVKQNPMFILKLYKTLNTLKKELPEAMHNQLEALFDKDEFNTVKVYSEEELPFGR